MTAHEIRDLLRAKKISSEEITKSVLGRIKEVEDKVEGYISILEEDSLKNAREVDKKIALGEELPDLAGIPMALKDNMCTEGILTTCASKILDNFRPPYNATVVEKLINAGAVLLGKVNMDEFAMGSSTENSYFKKTKNPYDISRVPGGSSGGSAAVVAADEAIYTLGSDTGGSIRQPAALCGVVGMKPTYGAVSRYGLVAFASSLDQIGPLTKDVTDCAIVLNAICGHDSKDSTSANVQFPDYTKALTDDVRGLKIGIPREFFRDGISDEVKGSVMKAIDVFVGKGAVADEFSIPVTDYALPAYYLISSAEASSNLARYDGIKYGNRAKKYDNLIDLYNQTRSEGFGNEVKRRIMIGTYALSSGYYDAYYKKAQQVRTLIKKSYDEAFKKYDVIITPATPSTAFKIGEKSDDPLEMYMADICTVSINIAGIPAIVIPCGYDSNGLPIGMQIIGKAFDEATLLRVAYAFEQNSGFSKISPKI